MARGGSRAPPIQGLASTALDKGQVVDNASIARRFAGDAHGIAQVPIAEHQTVQMHHAAIDRDFDMAIIEIRIVMQRKLHAITHLGVRNGMKTGRSYGCGGAAKRYCQTGANGRSVVFERGIHGGLR